MAKVEIVNECPLCGGEGKYWDEGGGPGAYTKVDKCLNCGVLYQNPRLNREALEEYYASGEYHIFHPSEVKSENNRAKTISSIVTSFELEPKRCLDIGCGRGMLLKKLQEDFGVEVVGYELNRDFPSEIDGVVHKKEDIKGEFDLITCIHVLEHTYNPLEELLWMKSLLSKFGTIVLEVPYDNKIYLPHTFVFDRMSIRLTLIRAGLDYIGLDLVHKELILAGDRYKGMKVERVVDVINAFDLKMGMYH